MFKKLLMLSLIFGIFSCDSSSKYDFNEVHIRIDNQTGLDLDQVSLGKKLIKPSSLRHIDFVHNFKNINKNEVTDYVNTKGKFNGYSSVVIYSPSGQRAQHRETLDAQLVANKAIEDTFENPLVNSLRTGLSLPKGKYTYKISLHENKNLVSVEIIKD